MSDTNKPVSIPLKAWIQVFFNEKELKEQYYQAIDIDPYIEELEQKLEAIRPFIMECKDIMVKEAILGVLGDE